MKELWIDALKGWLILLVVLGHVFGALSHMTSGFDTTICRGLYFLIYSFHMPAFFFVSGWLWHEKSLKVFLVRRTRRLLVPYFTVGIISIFVFAVIGGMACMGASMSDGYYAQCEVNNGAIVPNLLALLHAGGWPNGEGLRFNSVLWFLPCMFLVQLTYWGITWISRDFKWLLMMAFFCIVVDRILSLTVTVCLPWGAGKVPYYLFFLILGDLCHRRGVQIDRLPLWAVCVSLFASIALTYVWVTIRLGNGVLFSTVKYVLPCCGICAALSVVQHLPLISKKVLAILGVSSIDIMLWHKFFISGAQAKVPIISFFCQSGSCGTIFAILILTGGSIVFSFVILKAWSFAKGRVPLLYLRVVEK